MSTGPIHTAGPVVVNQCGATSALNMDGCEVTLIRRSAVADLLQAAPFRLAACCAAIGFGLGLGVLLPALVFLVVLR